MTKKRKPQTPEKNAQDRAEGQRSAPKKIKNLRKKQKRKASRVVAHPISSYRGPIEQFISQNSIYFTSTKQTLLEEYERTLRPYLSVKKLMSNLEGAVFDIAQADCQQELRRYAELLKGMQACAYQKLGMVGQMGAFSVSMLRREGEGEEGNARQRQFLSPAEDQLLQRVPDSRGEVMQWSLEQLAKRGLNRQYNKNEIKLQILALTRMDRELQHEIMAIIHRATRKEDFLFNFHEPEERPNLSNEYRRILITRNFERGLENQAPIDFFNYFKSMAAYEDNGFMETDFVRIRSWAQFLQYLDQKKPGDKTSDRIIRTPCSACLSDFAEPDNPILRCRECPIRVHAHCQKLRTYCSRCSYMRIQKNEKGQTGYCYICARKCELGLMTLQVNNSAPHYFAHNFCLLAHNLWRVSKKEKAKKAKKAKTNKRDEEKSKEGEEDENEEGFQGLHIATPHNDSPCVFCSKTAGITIRCSHCSNSMHAMCAYLSGASFRMIRRTDAQDVPYKIEAACCREESLRLRLSMERKFKLNFEKLVFRDQKKYKKENAELYDYIESVVGAKI